MKSFKILSLLALSTLLVGCGASGRGNAPTPTPEEPTWSDAINAEMNKYIGEVLPFVQLDDETIQYGYNDTYSLFYIYDDNETNSLDGYDQKLINAGFVYTETDYYGETYVSYDKTNDVGFVSVDFGWAEATSSEPAGNYINVTVPEWIDEETLIASGYEKSNGWPTQIVADTLEGTGITISPVNANGEWYVATDTYVDDDDGSSYDCAYLVTEGDFFEEIYDDLSGHGLAFDEDWGCFYDASQVTDAEIYPSLIRGYTVINVYGQTIEPEPVDVTNETTNEDGSITIAFTFGGSFSNGQTFDEHTFESESAELTVSKGTANNPPAYYDNGQTLRFYAGSTITITSVTDYEIRDVELTIGPSNNKAWTNEDSLYDVTAGTLSATESETTVTTVEADTLTITLGVGKSGGNIAFSAITVTVIAK